MKWIFALLTLALVGNLLADPRQWDADGIPVRSIRAIYGFSATSRADGTRLVVWAQSQGTVPVVMGQLFSPGGLPLWNEDGIRLAQGDLKAGFPIAAAVAGGWVIVWQDAEIIASGLQPETGWSGFGTVRYIKIDDNGVPVWAGGRAGQELVPSTEWWSSQPYTIFESQGGVIVTWMPTSDQFARKISADGQVEWPEPVSLSASLNYEHSDIASDLNGGLIFAWRQVVGGQSYLYANKLLPNGTFAWNGTTGALLYSGAVSYYGFSVCPDGFGGAYVLWIPNNGDNTNLYAQRLSAQGEVLWQQNGLPILAATWSDDIRAVATSYSNGTPDGLFATMYMGQDERRLVGQKVSPTGTLTWGADGTEICTADPINEDLGTTTLLSDQSGGALCYYSKRIYEDIGTRWEMNVARIAADESRPWGQGCGVTAMEAECYSGVLTAPALIGNEIQIEALGICTLDGNKLRSQRLNLSNGTLINTEPLVIATGDPHRMQNAAIAKLGNGSTVVAWDDESDINTAPYFQIMNVFGEPQLPNNGRPLCIEDDGTPIDGNQPTLCPDGSGGFFAAFRFFQDGFYILRAAHLDAQGNYISRHDGVAIPFEGTTEVDRDMYCLPDGSGGCYISVAVYDSVFQLETMTTRVNSLCQPIWEHPVEFTVTGYDVLPFVLVPSADRSVIVGYSRLEFYNNRVLAARISENGEVLWNVVVSDSVQTSTYSWGACSDNQNGLVLTWGDVLQGEDIYTDYAQRVFPSGNLAWGTDGVQITQNEYSANHLSCSADQVGNTTIAWEVFDGQDLDIFAQRIRPDGATTWQEGGISLCAAENDQYNPEVFAISDNEVYVLWTDNRVSGQSDWSGDIYGTHLNARGQIRDDSYWQADGSPICNLPYMQQYPIAIADGAGGVTLTWMDQRSTSNWEYSVFAQRLYDPIFTDANEEPVLPTEFSLSQNYPNPFNPETNIEFTLPNTGKATLNVFDVTGRLVTTLVDEMMTAGVHQISFNGSNLASGVYFYSLKAGSNVSTRKMVLLK